MRWLPALAIVALVSGCLGGADVALGEDSTSPKRLGGRAGANAAIEEIPLLNGSSTTIELQGTGWGRVDFVAQERLTVKVTLTNDDFQVSNAGNRTRPDTAGEARYGLGNHSFFTFTHRGEPPIFGTGFSAMWWGLPNGWVVPNGGSHPLELSAGDAATLLVATSVPGFRLQFDAGLVASTPYYVLPLIKNSAYRYIVPEESVTATIDHELLRVQRQRDWTTGKIEVQPGLLRGVGWDISGATAGAPSTLTGVAQDYMGAAPERGSEPAQIPSPEIPGTSGAGFRYPPNIDLSEPALYEVYRTRTEYTAGIDAHQIGMAVVTLPWALPVEPRD